MTVPGPSEIVGRNRIAVWVLILGAAATLAVTLWRSRAEISDLRAELGAATRDRVSAADDRDMTNRKLDEALRQLARAGEDRDRLQREIAELALATTEEERRRIISQFNADQRRADQRRAADDERRSRENERPDPPRPPAPSPSRTVRPTATPPPTRSPSPSPSPVCLTPLRVTVCAPLPAQALRPSWVGCPRRDGP